ncbi:MAG: response regulator [Succinivibrio sp.]|nr:response regulator [Succinivibrio sp.]
MRLLLVEDDPLIAQAVQTALTARSHAVDLISDGTMAREAPAQVPYDCVLLDLGLPQVDGVTLLREWRQRRLKVPVIIITARDGLTDRIKGLDAGADDYLVKPFDLSELEARLRAVVRRSAGSSEDAVLSNGVLSLSTVTHEVTVRDTEGKIRQVQLTAREFSVLEALLKRPGAVLSREAIEDRIYSFGQEVESNAVEFIIHNLRKKVGGENIKNVRGVGWKVVARAEP